MQLLYRLWPVNGQSFQQPAQLLSGYPAYIRRGSWPLEVPILQTLVQEDETVPLPKQCLHTVTFMAAEEKENVGERIQPEVLLDDGSKAIYGFPHIGISTGKVNRFCP